MEEVLIFLNKNKIKYTLHEHPAVFTCDEAEKYCGDIPGLHSKNLFLQSEVTKQEELVSNEKKSSSFTNKSMQSANDQQSVRRQIFRPEFQYFLLLLPAEARADLKNFAKYVGVKKVSFGKEETLMDKLGLKTGSVSLFGLLNDIESEVKLYIDQQIYDADVVSFHPNVNTATVEMVKSEFHKVLQLLVDNFKVGNFTYAK